MANFLKKYGVWEYLVFVLGAVSLIKIGWLFWTDQLEASFLNGVVFVVSILMVAAPGIIVDAAKRKVGKNDSIKSNSNG